MSNGDRVRRSGIIKTIDITDKIAISIREEEITVYKVITKPNGRKAIVYTFDAEEWMRILPALAKVVKRYA